MSQPELVTDRPTVETPNNHKVVLVWGILANVLIIILLPTLGCGCHYHVLEHVGIFLAAALNLHFVFWAKGLPAKIIAYIWLIFGAVLLVYAIGYPIQYGVMGKFW